MDIGIPTVDAICGAQDIGRARLMLALSGSVRAITAVGTSADIGDGGNEFHTRLRGS
jgi:hypothetical protein